MKIHVGYHVCPNCGASFPTTHYKDCEHKGKDPRDIPSPLSK